VVIHFGLPVTTGGFEQERHSKTELSVYHKPKQKTAWAFANLILLSKKQAVFCDNRNRNLDFNR